MDLWGVGYGGRSFHFPHHFPLKTSDTIQQLRSMCQSTPAGGAAESSSGHCAQTQWGSEYEQISGRTSASPVGSVSVQAGALERYREGDCSPCSKMMYIHVVKILQTSSTMGSKGIGSNKNRGIKTSPYFDIHLNWHCHQSPLSLFPDSLTCRHTRWCLLYSAGTNIHVPLERIAMRSP